MTPLRFAALAVVLASAAPSCAWADGIMPSCATGQNFSHGGITVTGAYMRATPPHAQSAAAYLVIANTGATPDTLTGASSAAAPDVTLHQMAMNGQVMEMAAVTGGLAVLPGASVRLDPMGYHLMLTGMSAPFTAGSCVELVLHFAAAGDLPVELNVGSLTQDGPPTSSTTTSSQPMPPIDMPSAMAMPM